MEHAEAEEGFASVKVGSEENKDIREAEIRLYLSLIYGKHLFLLPFLPFSAEDFPLLKFLALLTIFAIPTGLICVYPLIMGSFGSVPMAESYLSVLAFFLYIGYHYDSHCRGYHARAVGAHAENLTGDAVAPLLNGLAAV